MAQQQAGGHAKIETNNFLMIVLIIITVAFGGLVEIVPLFFQKSTTQPIPGLKPYTALQLAGRDIYIREGCYLCHSQMIRPFRAEALRYGPYSVAGESVYDHPFQWGSKRNGPDLARVGGRYSDEWHRVHLNNPRDVVPESIMPAFPWLARTCLSSPDDCQPPGNHKPFFPWQPAADTIQAHMKGMHTLGVPYTDEDIANAPNDLKGKTELDALIAYLQGLGIYRQ
jgi:cytochrome c oxidase cbb3-type subunit 2